MKPLKDLAEYLTKDNKVNKRAMERFNYNMEAIRSTTLQHKDHLNALESKGAHQTETRYLASLIYNLEF